MNRRALLAAPLALELPRQAQASASAVFPLGVPGKVVAIGGQSNSYGTNPLAGLQWCDFGLHDAAVPYCYFLDGTWGLLRDPIAKGVSTYPVFANPSAGASVWPEVARQLLSVAGSMSFIPCGKSGSQIGAWTYRPTGGLSILDQCVQRIRDSGVTPDVFTWWQGESDAKPIANISGTQWKSYLAIISNRMWSEFGCPTMVAIMQTCDPSKYGNQGIIQQAQREAPSEVPHVIAGPDLSSLYTVPESDVHLASYPKVTQAGALWSTCLRDWWGL